MLIYSFISFQLIILTVFLVFLYTIEVDAKTKKHSPYSMSKHDYRHLEKLHKQTKRSAHGRSWPKANYGNYGLPPYLVYNGKVGAYYPYFKYPENAVRRTMNKLYNKYH